MGNICTNTLQEQVRAIIAEVCEIEPERITPEADFVEELGMDSMMALEILAAIEKKFKVQIPEEKLGQLKNLKQSVDMTMEYLKGTA